MRYPIRTTVLGLVLGLAFPPSASGSSQLNFPRLSFESTSITGIAIVNPTNEDAFVSLTALNSNGGFVNGPGFTNPVFVVIPAGTQYARVAFDIFGANADPSTIAWIQAQSSVTGLTGFFLFLNQSISQFDGADLASASPNLAFNDIRLDGDNSTEINLVNPLPESVTASVRFSGMPETERVVLLGGKGVSRFDVAELFDLTSLQSQGLIPSEHYLEVNGSGPIGGFQLVRVGSGDTLGLNATSRNVLLSRLFFPQLAVLPPFVTSLILSNFSSQEVLVSIRAYRPDGNLYGPADVARNPVTRTIAGESRLEEDIEELFGFSGVTTRQGWILVEASQASINGSISYTVPESNARASVAGLGQGTNRALFSHIATAGGFFTGLAVLNAGSLAANVRVVALDPSGKVLGSFTTVLQPRERISRLIADIIPAAAGKGGGFIWVGSDVPVFLTSLFGNLVNNVLANIPPQPVPPSYRPDVNIPQLRIMPPLAVVQPAAQQNFAASGAVTQNWSVDGMVGGNAVVGTVNNSGHYAAPVQAPAELPVTVSANSVNQSSGASVDILESVEAASGLGNLQSVIFLEGLKKLYTAEFTLGGAAAAVSPATPPNSAIFDVSTGSPQLVLDLGAQEIPDMEAFLGIDGREYLILAGKFTGQILRLDPETKDLLTIVDGLNQPEALVVDSVSGSLLVATGGGVLSFDRELLDSGLIPAASNPHANRPARLALADGVQASGLAIDHCQWNIYLSDRQAGKVLRLNRGDGQLEEVAANLEAPTHLQALYRSDVSCPDSFHLLVYEAAAERLSLIVPSRGLVESWVGAPGGVDLTFIPDTGQPIPNMGTQSAVVSAEIPLNAGRLSAVLLPDLYRPQPLNPMPLANCFGAVQFSDPNLEVAVREAVNNILAVPIGPSEPLPCDALDLLDSLDALQANIVDLNGIDAIVNLTRLNVAFNSISDLNPLQGLDRLVQLIAFANEIDPQTLPELPALRSLDVTDNAISDLAPFTRYRDLLSLDCGLNRISSLEPLAELSQLHSLGASGNQINDVGPLADLPNLMRLTITDNLVTTLNPLAGLSQLETLNASQNEIASLLPIANLKNLKQLFIGTNPIDDISPIAGFSDLEQLGIDDLGLSNLNVITPLDRLQTLNVSNNPGLTSLQNLAGKNQLQLLFASACAISNIDALAALPRLRLVNLTNNRISELAPLVNNPALGTGDFLFLAGNPLGPDDCPALNALSARGVNVFHNVSCPN